MRVDESIFSGLIIIFQIELNLLKYAISQNCITYDQKTIDFAIVSLCFKYTICDDFDVVPYRKCKHLGRVSC